MAGIEQMRARLANGNDLVLLDIGAGNRGKYYEERYLRIVEMEQDKPYTCINGRYLVGLHAWWEYNGFSRYKGCVGENTRYGQACDRAEAWFNDYLRKQGLFPDAPKKCMVDPAREYVCRDRQRLVDGHDIVVVEAKSAEKYYVAEVLPGAEFKGPDGDGVLRVIHEEPYTWYAGPGFAVGRVLQSAMAVAKREVARVKRGSAQTKAA